MKILAVDTTQGVCSVALLNNKKPIAQILDVEGGKQAESLLSIIEQVLDEGKIIYSDLDAIAVNIGPGSFTGVRIGLAAVKGINLVNKTPLIGVTSLEAVAYPVSREKTGKNIFVVLDAKREQVFCQMFSCSMEPLSEPLLLRYSEVCDVICEDSFVVAGNGVLFIEEFLEKCNLEFSKYRSSATLSVVDIACLADEKFSKAGNIDNISPLYVRKPDAKLPKSN